MIYWIDKRLHLKNCYYNFFAHIVLLDFTWCSVRLSKYFCIRDNLYKTFEFLFNDASCWKRFIWIFVKYLSFQCFMFYLSAKHSQNNHLKLGHAVTFILYLAHVVSLIFQPKNLTWNKMVFSSLTLLKLSALVAKLEINLPISILASNLSLLFVKVLRTPNKETI